MEFMQGPGTSPFPPTGIYYRLAHKCLVPRFFAYGSEWSVGQIKGRPFNVQAKGQLWPTRAFYAECAQVRAGRNSRNADFILIAPLKGKRLTTFCASLALLHPLLSLTHWIFRSLMLPYKSSSLVQNVFAVHRFAQGAADWRSGPRWSIISVLCPVHPFPLRGTSPQGETRK